MTTKYNRHQIEEFIVQEQTILQECVDLLNRRTPLADWPHEVRVAFLAAIWSEDGKEAYKAFSTARHLRLNKQFFDYAIPENLTPLQCRCAERIRANLTKLVRLGAGSYLQT